ncbi:MAG: TnsA endonuclease N-terminal domain-containing protein [Candidatus Hodarchaeota archaeon]
MEAEDWSCVRSIPPKTEGNQGFFPSEKVMGGIVAYESQLERDLFLLFDHDPSVKRFQHQPSKIIFKNNEGKREQYVPDVKVEFNNGLRVLIEVKPRKTIVEKYSMYQQKLKAVNKEVKANGMIFDVLTEIDIRTPRLANVWFTLGASKCLENNKYIDILIKLLKRYGKRGISYNNLCMELAELLGLEIGKASQVVCYASYHGLVFIDTFTTEVLSKNTIIREKQLVQDFSFRPLFDEFDWSFSEPTSIHKNHPPMFQGDDNESIEEETILDSLIPTESREIVEKRLKIIELWEHSQKIKSDSLWVSPFLTKWKISERTISRWRRNYQENGIEGLIPQHNKKGRKSQFSPEVLKLIEKARKSSLLLNKTQKSAYDDLKRECKKNGYILPSFSTFRYYIYQNSTAAERALLTKGKRHYQTHFTPSIASFMQAILPMQVLQLDNTSFDIFPVDSEYRLPIGTPNVTTAIDCYTRMITGFYLTLSACSSLTILETLVQSIQPKKYYEETFNTESPWPINGFPVLILVDNGMDYRSKDVKRFCMNYNIILEFAPLRKARYKAYIEKWFDVLRNGLKREDVKGLRPKLIYRIENPDLRPEEEAILSMHEIQTWVHQWIIDEYHFRNSYNDHLPAPYLRWENAKNCQTDIILPLPREPPKEAFKIAQLVLSSLMKKEITLTSKGVQFLYLKFRNPELDQVFATTGKTKVEVWIDRRNIRNVWIINPINKKPIKTSLGEGWASIIMNIHGDIPIDLTTWKKTCKEIRKYNIREITPFAYHKHMSRRKREQLLEKGRMKTKRVRHEKEKMIENKERTSFSRLSPTTTSKVENDIIIEETTSGDKTVKNKPKIKKKEEIDWDTIQPIPSRPMGDKKRKGKWT